MELREAVEHFGQDSNSFFSLYPGFESEKTTTPPSWIAYVPVSGGKVGISEPFCEDDQRFKALEVFFKRQKELKQSACCLPIRKKLATICRSHQWKTIQIGTEPQFHLPTYMRWHGDLLQRVPAAHHLSNRGATVREIPSSLLTPEFRLEINHILEDWYRSRKLPPLGFLNRVEPWVHFTDKKLFVLEWQGKPMAFLSALPIAARHGWYFVDLIRKSDAPAGSTELLILEAMKIVHAQKYDWVSLGVSPLAGLKDTEFGQFPLLYRALSAAFNYGNLFYGFRSLYEYKLKFQPTHLEPVYLVAPAHERLSKISKALKEAYFSAGIGEMVFFTLNRSIRDHVFEKWLSSLIRVDLMLKSLPGSLLELFSRTRFSLAVSLAWWIAYLRLNNHHGILAPERIAKWGFTGSEWVDFTVFHTTRWAEVLLASPFLHGDRLHLISNFFLFILFVPLAEILLGSRMIAMIFTTGMLIANPLTALFLAGAVKAGVTGLHSALETPDIGGSLGLFAVMGAFFSVFKNRTWFLAGTSLFIILFALHLNQALHLNHVIALGWGVIALSKIIFVVCNQAKKNLFKANVRTNEFGVRDIIRNMP